MNIRILWVLNLVRTGDFGPSVDTGNFHEIPHSYHNKKNLVTHVNNNYHHSSDYNLVPVRKQVKTVVDNHNHHVNYFHINCTRNSCTEVVERIDEADCDLEEEIRLINKLLYDNSSPRPPKEINSENSNSVIESFSPSPIPVEDSDPFMEEIDLFLTYDGSIPPGIDSDYSDSEGNNLFPERLLHDDPIPLLDILDFSNVD
nr:hypothetical protein [Tanacetum cinerariifolium]